MNLKTAKVQESHETNRPQLPTGVTVHGLTCSSGNCSCRSFSLTQLNTFRPNRSNLLGLLDT